MAIKLGSGAIAKLYLGATQINKAYLGPTLIFGGASGPVGTAPSAASVVSYWKLEDTTDSGPNGNDLTNGGATSGVTGVINNGYSFLAGDYMTDPSSTATYSFVKNTGVFTISFWAKIDDYTADAFMFLISNDTSSSASQGFDVAYENRSSQGSPQRLQLVVVKGTGGTTAFEIKLNSAIVDNEWHHYLFTGNGTSGTMKLYIDKEEQSPTVTFVGLATGNNANNLTIGGLASAPTSFNWVGAIDEVLIADENYSQANVDYLYQTGTPGTAQQYPFT